MPKLKTNRGAKKRFRFTASGKIKRRRAFKSHLLQTKGPDRKRRLRRGAFVSKGDEQRIKLLLPGH